MKGISDDSKENNAKALDIPESLNLRGDIYVIVKDEVHERYGLS